MVDPHLVPILVAYVFRANGDALLEGCLVVSHVGIEPAMRAGPRRQSQMARAAFVHHHHAGTSVLRGHRGVQAREAAADNQHVAVVDGFLGSFGLGNGKLGGYAFLAGLWVLIASLAFLRRAASQRRQRSNAAGGQAGVAQKRAARYPLCDRRALSSFRCPSFFPLGPSLPQGPQRWENLRRWAILRVLRNVQTWKIAVKLSRTKRLNAW